MKRPSLSDNQYSLYQRKMYNHPCPIWSVLPLCPIHFANYLATNSNTLPYTDSRHPMLQTSCIFFLLRLCQGMCPSLGSSVTFSNVLPLTVRRLHSPTQPLKLKTTPHWWLLTPYIHRLPPHTEAISIYNLRMCQAMVTRGLLRFYMLWYLKFYYLSTSALPFASDTNETSLPYFWE
jgi:hypothetical protein